MKDEMQKAYADRIRFLNALLDYASCSSTSNPHFQRTEMMKKLGVTEGAFNIMQKNLGDRYCQPIDIHGGDMRYAIDTSECWQLRDQLEQGRLHSEHSALLRENNEVHERHMRIENRLVILSFAILAVAILALVLTAYPIFFPKSIEKQAAINQCPDANKNGKTKKAEVNPTVSVMRHPGEQDVSLKN